jgi:hypothetical protein
MAASTMKKASSPWASGPGEILNHAFRLLKKDGDTNRRLAMISVDNALELMVKTFLGLPKRITKLEITRKELDECGESFPRLIDALEKHAKDRIQGIDLGEIEWYHRLRNQLYHQGNGLTVERDKVEVYAELAKIMFASLFGFDLVEPEEDGTSVIGTFLTEWVELEKLLNMKATEGEENLPKRPLGTLDMVIRLRKQNDLSEYNASEIDKLRSLRNDVVHGRSDHAAIQEQKGIDRLTQLVKTLRTAWTPQVG